MHSNMPMPGNIGELYSDSFESSSQFYSKTSVEKKAECSLCVVSCLIGHQRKQHHHVGGLGESMTEEQTAAHGEENDPHFFYIVLSLSLVCLNEAKQMCVFEL